MESVRNEHEPMRIVVLANQPRMFRELLHRALGQIPGAQLILETEDPLQVPGILSRVQTDWLVVSLNSEDELPKSVRKAIEEHPALSVLGFSEDSSRVEVQKKMHEKGNRTRRSYALENVSLPELLSILENDQAG